MKRFIELLLRFKADRQGAIALMFAIVAPVSFLVMGSGVDFGRTFMIKNKLHQSIDAAALAGASMPAGTPEATRTANIRKYFAINFPNPYLGMSINPSTLAITYTPNGDNPTKINVNVPADVPTTFLQFANINTLAANSETEVAVNSASGADIDIVLVIDKTSSMKNYVTTMQDALDGLVDKFVTAPDKSKVRFNIVFYNTNQSTVLDWTDMNDETAIRDAIDTYSTSGCTDGGSGAKVGRDNILSVPARADGKTGAVKAFVFMTDGEFNAYPNYYPSCKKGPSSAKTASQNAFLSACNGVKNAGILAYTIAFRTHDNDALLKACASDPDSEYFFYTDTGTALANAFSNIGTTLSNLRISK